MIDRNEEVPEIGHCFERAADNDHWHLALASTVAGCRHAALADFSKRSTLSIYRCEIENNFWAVASALGLAEQHAKPEDALHNV